MVSLFFSYSHKDEDLRNQLETHLSLLKRQAIISTWHDRRISAGGDIGKEISSELEAADIVLLLVSADFLASDYCYEKEMTRAIEKHNEGSAIVVPVILHPCDWQPAPFGGLRATPTDGKPVSMFANPHEAFSIVAKDIRIAAEQHNTIAVTQSTAVRPVEERLASAHPRSSNLRIKRRFDDHERDAFLENSYEYISRFFDGSLSELEMRNAQIKTKFKRLDNRSFTASLYEAGVKVAACSIWHGGSGRFESSSIFFSSSEGAPSGSYNESISVSDDGYALQLKPLGMATFSQNAEEALTQQGAAEYLWGLFIAPLQT